MQFAKQLREGVRRGFITTTVRIWQQPRVKVGGRYRMEEGAVVVDSIEEISPGAVSTEMAVESGFDSRADLLKIARHGAGNRVFLIRFHYTAAAPAAASAPASARRRTRS